MNNEHTCCKSTNRYSFLHARLLLVPYCRVLVAGYFSHNFLIIDAQLCLAVFLPIAFNHFTVQLYCICRDTHRRVNMNFISST